MLLQRIRSAAYPGSNRCGFVNRATNNMTTPARRMLTSTVETTAKPSEQRLRVVYQGGFDKVLRILKRVSIFSCTCTLVGVPLLAMTSNNPRMQGIQKWAVAFVVVAFGVTTTVALHIVAKPYVCRLLLDSTGELMHIETMNMIGRTKISQVELSKVVKSEKPWATFASSKDPKMAFFVEEAPDAYLDQTFKEKLFSKIGGMGKTRK